MTDQTAQDGAAEPVIEPVIADQGAATDQATETGAEATAAAAPTEGAEDPDKPKRTPWWEKRLSEVTGQRREAERERDAMRAERDAYKAVADGQAAPTDGTAPKPPVAPQRAFTEADVERRAQEIAQATEFNHRANAIAEAARAAHPDFDAVRDRFVANLGEAVQARPDFLEAVVELPQGAEVFYALAKDPDRAAEVLQMPPMKMALELARMNEQFGKPAGKQVSSAPPPITPIEASRTTKPFDPADPAVDMATWMREMDKIDAAKRQRA